MNNNFKNDGWINSFYTIDNEIYRAYDNSINTTEQVFINELGFFFKKLLIEHDLELYYIYNEPKHKIAFSNDDLNFFKDVKIFQKNLNIPKNVEIVRNMQYEDLLNFYNNYIFNGVEVFFVISKMAGNFYYYDLVLAVKKNFNLEGFFKKNFNLIKLKNLNRILLRDINFNYVQNLFNFEELKSYSFKEVREDSYQFMMDRSDELCKEERAKLDGYKQFCYKNKINTNEDPMFIWYLNESSGKFNEVIDDLVIFRNFSKNFGWLFFILSHEFKDEEVFYKSDLTYDNLICLVKQVEELKQTICKNVDDELILYEKDYEYFSFLDIIYHLSYSLSKGYCIILHNIFMKKFEYGTTHKQRLRLFENKVKKN